MQFSIKDIDTEKAYKRAMFDATNTIIGPEKYKNGRSDNQIKQDALQGQLAEQYLLDNGFTDCLEKYHDLYDKNGKIVEIKTSRSKINLENQYNRIKKANWNHSDYIMGFLFKQGIYTLVLEKSLK